jgi:hypothetical protein
VAGGIGYLNHEQRLDTGTAGSTGGAIPRLAILDAVHGPEEPRGEGHERHQFKEARRAKPSRN